MKLEMASVAIARELSSNRTPFLGPVTVPARRPEVSRSRAVAMNDSGNESTTGFVRAGGAGGTRRLAARWCTSGRPRVVADATGWTIVVGPLCFGSATRVAGRVIRGTTGAGVLDGGVP
jgi:hypothetical protein